ncbi:hypothetical protein BKA66DRAFT_461600 [Pyrenochaeta sp. MPI-SDFR-AT-0127]|nr:hypothetical protein BKA66DRAFT_461600 [Pyrenochaeta sp. MPI-SDFR-AT-0127]
MASFVHVQRAEDQFRIDTSLVYASFASLILMLIYQVQFIIPPFPSISISLHRMLAIGPGKHDLLMGGFFYIAKPAAYVLVRDDLPIGN